MKRAFKFLNLIELPEKPRNKGIIEIRGPYYKYVSLDQLKDLLNTWGYYIDGFKFAGGSQSLLPKDMVKEMVKVCHKHKVYVNTGGMIERVIIDDVNKVIDYIKECKQLEFDVVEVSSGMFENPNDFSIKDQIEIVKIIIENGLKAKPEVSIISGAGAGTEVIGYKESIKYKDLKDVIKEAEEFFKAGAYMVTVESEGITEGLPEEKWRKDVIIELIKKFGIEKLMFEVSPEENEARKTFKWYLTNVDRWINLIMNSENIVEFNAWRLNLWGNKDLWKNKKISISSLLQNLQKSKL